MAYTPKSFKVEGAQLLYRNFEGREDMYNPAGNRNFSVVLDEETAATMAADGWNVKRTKDRDEDGVITPGVPYIPIAVSYKVRPPRIVMISQVSRTDLGEEEVGLLDWSEIINADLIANGSDWSTPSGLSGTKAYLQTLFVTVRENELELKYANVHPEEQA